MPSCNHFCCRKAVSITYSECVPVVLVIQHAKHMRRVVLSHLASLALQYFSTLPHKRCDYRKKTFWNLKCVFWFSPQLWTFIILRWIQRVFIINVRMSLYRVSQEERTKLRESVPYVKLYRYNPKHLCPKLNGYGDNGQRKVWTSCISAYCTSTAV